MESPKFIVTPIVLELSEFNLDLWGLQMLTLINITKFLDSDLPNTKWLLLSYFMKSVFLIYSAMGTFLFESRLGCFGPNPPIEAQDFIQNLQGLFHLMQELMYSLPIYKIVPTKMWKQFETYCDNVFQIGRSYVNKVYVTRING